MARSDKGDAGDIELRVSLFRDAVVSLVACFDDTSPVHLDPDRVYGETPGGAEYFQWLKNIRHTWIGHRGGPLRQCVVAVVLDESTGDFRGIGHLSQVWLNPKAEAGDDLVRMMEIALIHARRELERCGSVVQDYVERMTSRERLQLPVARTIAPGPLDIHMGDENFITSRTLARCEREKNTDAGRLEDALTPGQGSLVRPTGGACVRPALRRGDTGPRVWRHGSPWPQQRVRLLPGPFPAYFPQLRQPSSCAFATTSTVPRLSVTHARAGESSGVSSASASDASASVRRTSNRSACRASIASITGPNSCASARAPHASTTASPIATTRPSCTLITCLLRPPGYRCAMPAPCRS